jgi:integrase
MASIIRCARRGTYQVQWHNGVKWVRVGVAKKRPGWKPGDPFPKKDPSEVLAKLAEYQRREDAAKAGRGSVEPGQSVKDFLAGYRAGYGAGHRASSAAQLDFAVARFSECCASEKVRAVSEVTPGVVDRFIRGRSEGRSYHTVSKEVGLLSGAWSRAGRLRSLPGNPWKMAEVPGQGGRRDSSWTREEYRRLLAACNPWLRNAVVIGCNTGLRASALLSLCWDDLEWGGAGLGFVRSSPSATRRRRATRCPCPPSATTCWHGCSSTRASGRRSWRATGASP